MLTFYVPFEFQKTVTRYVKLDPLKLTIKFKILVYQHKYDNELQNVAKYMPNYKHTKSCLACVTIIRIKCDNWIQKYVFFLFFSFNYPDNSHFDFLNNRTNSI